VRFPNSVDTDSLTTEEKQFVCTSALLEDSFKALDNGRDKRYGKAYIGTNSGTFRSYPSTSQVDKATGRCEDFDPRFRPWYVTATSGAKNVIIIIDTSGSMYGQKLTIAKDAATNVVNTLSNSDFVGVLQFGSSAEQVYTKKITRATTEVKDAIIEEVNHFRALGGTNYQAAFTKGLALLEAAQEDEYGAPCNDGENIFLFLTDGEPTVGLTNSADLIRHIDSERGSH
jgi:voltage-dependent calcium channel alpha-2/delta-1